MYSKEGVNLPCEIKGQPDLAELYEPVISWLDRQTITANDQENMEMDTDGLMSLSVQGGVPGVFMVRHYQGDEVSYELSAFPAQDRVDLTDDLGSLLAISTHSLIRNFSTMDKMGAQGLSARARKWFDHALATSPASQETKNLTDVQTCRRHFIVCFPSSADLTFFSPSFVLNQLNLCGVTDAMRIHRSGLPVQILLQDFTNWRRALSYKKRDLLSRISPLESVRDITVELASACLPQGEYQVGQCVLFMTTKCLNLLEDMILEQQRVAALTLQASFRSSATRGRVRLSAIRRAVRVTQRWVRSIRYRIRRRKIRLAARRMQRFLARCVRRFRALRARKQVAANSILKRFFLALLFRLRFRKHQALSVQRRLRSQAHHSFAVFIDLLFVFNLFNPVNFGVQTNKIRPRSYLIIPC